MAEQLSLGALPTLEGGDGVNAMQTGGHLAEVQAAYRNERVAVRGASLFRLRWRHKELRRRAAELGDIGRAQLKAVRDEFDARGHEVPA